MIGLGYFFGHSLHAIEKALGVGGVVAVVTAAIVGARVLAALREAEAARARRDDAAAAPPRGLTVQPSGQRGDARPAAVERLGQRDDVDGVDLRAHAHVVGEIGAHRSRALCEA